MSLKASFDRLFLLIAMFSPQMLFGQDRPTIQSACPDAQQAFAVYSATLDKWCYRQLPKQDGDLWLAIYDRHQATWVYAPFNQDVLTASKLGVPGFGSGYQIWFFYGVRPARSQVGAVNPKVTRYFKDMQSRYFQYTALYRGEDFTDCKGAKKGEYDNSEFLRIRYRAYHNDNQVYNPELGLDFHSCWDAGKNSAERRELFLFEEEPTEPTALQRSYLFRYTTTSSGSWIPFSVGTRDSDRTHLRRIKIIVNDITSGIRDHEIKRELR